MKAEDSGYLFDKSKQIFIDPLMTQSISQG